MAMWVAMVTGFMFAQSLGISLHDQYTISVISGTFGGIVGIIIDGK
jgi:hypothetical protein